MKGNLDLLLTTRAGLPLNTDTVIHLIRHTAERKQDLHRLRK